MPSPFNLFPCLRIKLEAPEYNRYTGRESLVSIIHDFWEDIICLFGL